MALIPNTANGRLNVALTGKKRDMMGVAARKYRSSVCPHKPQGKTFKLVSVCEDVTWTRGGFGVLLPQRIDMD
jgi:hypothetical protein